LEGANLAGVSLTKSQIYSTNLRNATLSHANLTRTHISDSDLSFSDLRHIDGKGIKFQGCNLTCANFKEANFRNLKESEVGFFEPALYNVYYPNDENGILNTKFNDCILDYAIFNNAILPEGLSVKSATGTRWPDGYSTATLTITNPNLPDPELEKIQRQWLFKNKAEKK
jgi:uncharacterized protein YjbI with pentapeptide repeats